MNERGLQFRVGVVMLSAVIIAAILVLLFGGVPTRFGTYKVQIPFTHAPGVSVGTPVRKSGVRIGEVTAVEILPNRKVLVTASIDRSIDLARSERPEIGTSNIFGDAIIEFVPTQPPTPDEPLVEPGQTVDEGLVRTNPLEVLTKFEDDMEEAIESFTKAGDSIAGAGNEVQQLASTVNGFLGNNRDQFNNILRTTDEAMRNFSRTMRSMNIILGDDKVALQLRQALADLPLLLQDTRETVVTARSAAARAEQAMDNLAGFTGLLDERGPELIDNVNDGVTRLGLAMEQFALFGEALNASEGTVGQLISNRELYDNLNMAVLNVQQATQQLRPILNDLRIFTDKISRDPSRLGVGGALDRRSITK